MTVVKKGDAFLGKFLAFLLPKATAGAFSSPGRILVIRPGGIGDAALLIPALAMLNVRFPDCRITILAEKRNAAVFILCNAAERVLCYDRPRELRTAMRQDYDLVIDTEQWHRLSAVVARLCSAPRSIGFGTNERARLFSTAIAYSHDDYEMDSFFHLLEPLGLRAPENLPIPFLTVPEAARLRADEFLAPLDGKRFVAIFPGASIPERRWGASRFSEVAHRLAGRGISVVAVGGGEDVADGERIAAAGSGFNLAGKCSLVESAAVIARSAVLLSGDSGILHLGVGLGVPTVSLFGPGIQAKWGPKGPRHIVLNRQLPCSPCTRFGTTPPCRIHSRCLSEISVDEVAVSVWQLLFPTDATRHPS
ncbi:glycosyltransferase family 9 protein [Geomonas sp. Red875]|uniref:Glycosyltransferase family 9 protein n=1 Tax=Geomesophilobacter sediminis TaxID=2798584 RepID=A0A8J7JBT5_9BACT|nr:glycosyltransferase family 9 protein [Geomesophilobacter sediminis]